MRSNPGPSRWTGQRSFGTALVALVGAASLSTAAGAGWAATHAAAPARPATQVRSAHVIVLAHHGALPRVEARTRLLGGTIERELPIVDGFSAKLPLAALPTLRLASAVLSVTPDGHLQTDGASYDPAADAGSMDATTTSLGVQGWWKAGTTGAGVDVALIDRASRRSRGRARSAR